VGAKNKNKKLHRSSVWMGVEGNEGSDKTIVN